MNRISRQPLARRLAATLLWLATAAAAQAQPAANAVVNIYSARHYQTDEAMYANFTKETGIQINRIEG